MMLSDADLVHRMRLLERHGPSKAAQLAGIKPTQFRQSIRTAKQKGLSAATKLTKPEDILRTKLKAAEAELSAIRRDNISSEIIRSQIYGLAEMTPDPPKWVGKATHSRNPGVPVTIWSDWHWGEKVNPAEVGGVNAFNRHIAVARVKRLVDTTIDLATRHMVKPQYPGIVVCLGGDMISGGIHEELRETNDGHVQQSLLQVQEVLESALSRMADVFGRVFESYEWNLYCQLERYFRDDRRVQFLIPSETDAHFTVLGHRFCLTHGDALGVRGGDGIIGAIGPITRGAIKIGRSEAQIGRDFDTLLMGHWHTYIPKGDATPVIVNGALKGYDEYARLFLRVPYSRPSQSLFFVHQDHGIICQWPVYVDDRRTSAATSKWVSWENRAA
jgi:hypothetical protein